MGIHDYILDIVNSTRHSERVIKCAPYQWLDMLICLCHWGVKGARDKLNTKNDLHPMVNEVCVVNCGANKVVNWHRPQQHYDH